MSTFTNSLKVELLDGRLWKLLEPFEYYFEHRGSQHTITVPKGYITDFASIPRFFWSILTYQDVFNKAAVVHDYLCDTNGLDIYSKKEVDDIYFDAQLVLKIPQYRSAIFYQCASWFGTINAIDYTKKV